MIDIKTTTRRLAIKITLIVFIFFFVTFSSLIWAHHYNFLYEEKQRLLSMSFLIKKDPTFLNTVFERKCKWKCEMVKDITRDFLVIKNWIITFKRGIYDFMDLEDFLKNNIDFNRVYNFDLEWDRDFYVVKTSYNWFDLYFTRDISFHTDYEQSLVILFLLLSVFLSFFIYLFSYKLAKLSLEPIKTYNESLKLYNHHIAHELKTPLSVLKSDLELLKMWIDDETLKSSLEEVDNMKSVIDSMLFLSENVSLWEKEEINIFDIINDLLDFYSKKTWKKIIRKFSKIKNINFYWDKMLLKTMLKNLLENAIKYSKDEKEIVVELTKNSVEIINTINYDFNEKDINKLFEAFYKLNFDSNSFWLWLSIVKKIVDLHWLKINIDVKDSLFKVKVEF